MGMGAEGMCGREKQHPSDQLGCGERDGRVSLCVVGRDRKMFALKCPERREDSVQCPVRSIKN